MKLYKCNRCEKLFNQKSHFDNHINRKFPCKPITAKNFKLPAKTRNKKDIDDLIIRDLCPQPQPQVTKINITCQYCGTNFSRKYNLKIHLDTRCKIKKQINSEKENIYNMLIKKMDKLEKSNKELQNTVIKLNRKNITNNTINSIHFEIYNVRCKATRFAIREFIKIKIFFKYSKQILFCFELAKLKFFTKILSH